MGPGVSVVDDSRKKAHLEDKRVELEQLKRVCFVNSDDGDRTVVWDSVPQDRRCVLLKNELTDYCHDLHQTSPVPVADVEDTPPSVTIPCSQYAKLIFNPSKLKHDK